MAQPHQEDARKLRVGAALLPKKVARYLTPFMLATAASQGVQLVEIDASAPLEQQGHFDVIIHKLRPNAAWERRLQEYVAAHPAVVVVDRLDRIRTLHNRATMLRPLQGDGITLHQPPQQQQQQQPVHAVRVQAPLQVELHEEATEADAVAALAAAGLAPPLLCKPLWADGREGSHGLAVLHDLEALGRLLRGCVSSEFKPPLVLQQFVEHGGVLFKVYVLGDETVVMPRPSLSESELEAELGVQQLPRISCVSVYSKQAQCQQQHEQQAGAAGSRAQAGCGSALARAAQWQPPAGAPHLPAWLPPALAATLRREIGTELFNFDLLVPDDSTWGAAQQQQQQQQQQQGQQQQANQLCYVVDVNYFPGVDKIPNFEERFVAFLKRAAQQGQAAQQPCSAAVAGAAPAGQARRAVAGAPGSTPPSYQRSSSGGGSRRSSSGGGYGIAPATAPPPGPSGCRSSPHHRRQHHGRSSSGGGSSHGSLDAGQWGDAGVLGSSPPLQVAGCS